MTPVAEQQRQPPATDVAVVYRVSQPSPTRLVSSTVVGNASRRAQFATLILRDSIAQSREMSGGHFVCKCRTPAPTHLPVTMARRDASGPERSVSQAVRGSIAPTRAHRVQRRQTAATCIRRRSDGERQTARRRLHAERSAAPPRKCHVSLSDKRTMESQSPMSARSVLSGSVQLGSGGVSSARRVAKGDEQTWRWPSDSAARFDPPCAPRQVTDNRATGRLDGGTRGLSRYGMQYNTIQVRPGWMRHAVVTRSRQTFFYSIVCSLQSPRASNSVLSHTKTI